MPLIESAFRKLLGKDLTLIFRQILYHRELSYGAKCLYFAVLDSPKAQIRKKSILAKRLGTDPSTVTRWIKELEKAKILFPVKNS